MNRQSPSSTSNPPVRRGQRAARLIALGHEQAGRVYPVYSGGGLIGRGEECEVRIVAPDLSRHHARISQLSSGEWQLADQGSRNGTLLNGKIIGNQAQPLRFGDRVQLGEQVLLFTRHDAIGDKLLELQKMDALGQLAAGVAHDFRNLLTAMRSNLEYIETELRSGLRDRDEVLDCVGETTQAIGRATELTQRLLTIARPGSQDDGEVELAALVEEVTALCRRTFPSSHTITAQTTPGLRVRGDRSALHQVVMNLCINGRDAMPRGGKLQLRLTHAEERRPTFFAGDAGPCALLEVSDEGEGMDEATQARIFEPFFSTKGKDGTGLGLATVYSVVRHHGGDVSVDSAPGTGATFRVLLPLGAKNRSSQETVSRIPSAEVTLPTGRGVLLVDDEAMVLSATRRLLESWGYQTYTAGSGAEAVQLFEDIGSELGCVIVDVQMPGLDGPSLLRILRLMDPKLRAIVTSARVNHDQIRGELASSDLFVPKPHGDNLKKALEELID